jgi:hypothetical protein
MRQLASLGVTGILPDRPGLALAEVRAATVAHR